MGSSKKKVAKAKTVKTDEPIDPRFAVAMQNPIYRRVPKKEKQTVIDKRFQSMFHDKKFKLKSTVDMRGRPVDFSTGENLKKYYRLLDKDEEDETTGEAGADKEQVGSHEPSSDSEAELGTDNVEGNVKESEIRSKNSKIQLSKTIKKKLRDVNVDYARGEGVFVTQESSDDSSSTEDEEDEEDTTHAWGELDRDAARTEEATSRLALCNMDWDRIKAVDLMVLFHSFVPPGGVLKSIKIYTSEYGKKRLADEEVNGPLELRQNIERNSDVSDNESDADKDDEESVGGDDEEGSHYHMEKLRKYQLNRLKYYYAVLEFDSVESAEKLYTECDGQEYESSATRIDLRYIPEDMTFDDEPKDFCDRLPLAEKYRPQFFTTTALQQAKVDLTWDETDPRRKELTHRVFDPKEKVEDEDIRAYLASSSDEEDVEVDGKEDSDGDVSSNVDPMAKYRALLESIEDSEQKKKEKDVEMEITWGVGLKAKSEGLVKKKLEESKSKDLTPWEEILAKKREKKKQRRIERKQKSGTAEGSSGDSSSDDDGTQLFSDDDVDVDMNDPFFKEEMEKNGISKKSKKKDKPAVEKPSESKGADNAALELLLMDDPEEDNKQHFSLKKIMENEGSSKSKKKRRNKKNAEKSEKKNQFQDTFEVDVKDERFNALFSSHLYNMDPSDPNFKKTKGMEAIITEKQKRRLVNPTDDKTRDETEPTVPKVSRKSELSYLVKSIKRNAQHMKKLQNKK